MRRPCTKLILNLHQSKPCQETGRVADNSSQEHKLVTRLTTGMQTAQLGGGLPRIDLRNSTAVDSLREVCRGTGFFYLKMSSVEVRVADRVLQMSKDFFKLLPGIDFDFL